MAGGTKILKPIVNLNDQTITSLRRAYKELSSAYLRLANMELVYCPNCGEWKQASAFYGSERTRSKIEHFACKQCIINMCTDSGERASERIDNREKTINVFRRLDWPFIEADYDSQLAILANGTSEKMRGTAVSQLITIVRSMPRFKGKTFADSKFNNRDENGEQKEEPIKIIQKTVKTAKARFGNNYTDEELMFLENDYQDWISRYECNTKAQEETFQNLAIVKFQKREAIKNGKQTKDLDRAYQDWLDTGNLKPKQNSLDTFSDAQTLGTLIQKYEETRPLPEIDPELEDVDKIGLYIDAFYRGHASKMLGLKNRFSHIYEKVMSKYTVTPPAYDEENSSEVLFDKIFGNRDE